MPWAVRYYDKNFNLEENFDPSLIEEIENSMVDRREIPGSFNILFHGDDVVTDITFSESNDANELPYRAIYGSHLQRFGEVYVFYRIEGHSIPSTVVLYENTNEQEPVYNEVRFPLAVTRQ
jgi:hypothetical protein